MAFMIPGSERFNSRPLPKEELMDRIDPSLALHQVDGDLVDALDPLTYEVVRHRLWAITKELGPPFAPWPGPHVVPEATTSISRSATSSVRRFRSAPTTWLSSVRW